MGYLSTLTDKQLTRLYGRVMGRIGDGWDAPTLRAVRPGQYNSLRAVLAESSRRTLARGAARG